jgi:hypothetical protein
MERQTDKNRDKDRMIAIVGLSEETMGRQERKRE